MAFSFFRPEIGFPALLAGTALLGGGRSAAGLIFYQAVSVALFLPALRRDLQVPRAFGAALALFTAAISISLLTGVQAASAGVVAISTWTAHALNFINLSSGGERASSRLDATVLALCSAFSAGILFQAATGGIPETFLPNKNLLASFLNAGLLILLFNGSETSKAFAAARALCAALIAGAQVCAFSVGAAAAFAASLTIAWKLRPASAKPMPRAVWFGALAAALLLAAWLPGMLGRITRLDQNQRWGIWKSAIEAAAERPLTGWGAGNFELAYYAHQLPDETRIGRYEKTTRFAHSEPLQVLVELGVFGAAIFLALLTIGGRASARSLREGGDSAAAAGFLLLSIHSLWDFNLHLPLLGFLWLAFASRLSWPSYLTLRARISRAILVVSGSAWLAALAWIGTARLWARTQIGRERARIPRFIHPPLGFEPEAAIAISSKLAPDDRRRLLERAHRWNPAHPRTAAALARTLRAEGNAASAAELYLIATAAQPAQPFHRAELSDAWLALGRSDAAQAELLQAIRIEPLYAFAHYRLGELLLAEGKTGPALQAFENAARILDQRLAAATEYEKRLLDLDPLPVRERLRSLREAIR